MQCDYPKTFFHHNKNPNRSPEIFLCTSSFDYKPCSVLTTVICLSVLWEWLWKTGNRILLLFASPRPGLTTPGQLGKQSLCKVLRNF